MDHRCKQTSYKLQVYSKAPSEWSKYKTVKPLLYTVYRTRSTKDKLERHSQEDRDSYGKRQRLCPSTGKNASECWPITGQSRLVENWALKHDRSLQVKCEHMNYQPVLLTVFVRSSAQSAGIPNTSTVTYGSTVLPLAPDAFGFGNC